MKRWILVIVLTAACLFLFYSLGQTANKLEVTAADLSAAQTELTATRVDLNVAKELAEVTNTELTSTQKVLDTAKNELTRTKNSLNSLQTELAAALNNLSAKAGELQSARDELERQQAELAALQLSYQGLVSGHGYNVKDPTYQQMLDFLKADMTDRKSYIDGEYECRHFATEVCNNADAQGIRCAYVSLEFPHETGHAIIAFSTIDKGIIYIEPQSDELVKLELGKRYYQSVIPSGGYTYATPSYDDTVLEVLVAW
ncbi:MAG: hypothetical protein PHR43_05815 [Dehalococcoidales bacterium]|nr:hypothetical protein [Dehalococcoidales bacterium]